MIQKKLDLRTLMTMKKIKKSSQVVFFYLKNLDTNQTEHRSFNSNKKSAKSQYILTDSKHNDLKLLFKVPVTRFFFSEECSHKVFYLRKKTTIQKNLLSLQEESVGVTEAQKSSQSEESTKELKNLLDYEFTKYFPGLKSYLEEKKYEAILIETKFARGIFYY